MLIFCGWLPTVWQQVSIILQWGISLPLGSPVKDVDEIVKEVEMVHLGRQCERIEHSCPFGSLMRTEEE